MSQEMPVPIRVLLVDDHQVVLWGLQKLLENYAPRIVVAGTASSAEDALQLAKQHAPDIVLLDVDLGDRSGVELIPELKTAETKVLILTGMSDTALLDACMAHGARGVISKQSSGEVIIKALQCVHAGEIWLERSATARLLTELTSRLPVTSLPPPSHLDKLTRREREIVEAVVAHPGAPLKVIASDLNIAEHTLRNHLSTLYAKLQVSSRIELFAYITEHDRKRA